MDAHSLLLLLLCLLLLLLLRKRVVFVLKGVLVYSGGTEEALRRRKSFPLTASSFVFALLSLFSPPLFSTVPTRLRSSSANSSRRRYNSPFPWRLSPGRFR